MYFFNEGHHKYRSTNIFSVCVRESETGRLGRWDYIQVHTKLSLTLSWIKYSRTMCGNILYLALINNTFPIQSDLWSMSVASPGWLLALFLLKCARQIFLQLCAKYSHCPALLMGTYGKVNSVNLMKIKSKYRWTHCHNCHFKITLLCGFDDRKVYTSWRCW